MSSRPTEESPLVNGMPNDVGSYIIEIEEIADTSDSQQAPRPVLFPVEIWQEISSYLELADKNHLRSVCRYLNDVIDLCADELLLIEACRKSETLTKITEPVISLCGNLSGSATACAYGGFSGAVIGGILTGIMRLAMSTNVNNSQYIAGQAFGSAICGALVGGSTGYRAADYISSNFNEYFADGPAIFSSHYCGNVFGAFFGGLAGSGMGTAAAYTIIDTCKTIHAIWLDDPDATTAAAAASMGAVTALSLGICGTGIGLFGLFRSIQNHVVNARNDAHKEVEKARSHLGMKP